jgi:outer membrane protein assembly factor BamB
VEAPVAVRCRACGTERPRAARFCPRCGAHQSQDADTTRSRRAGPTIAALAAGLLAATSLAIATVTGGVSPASETSRTTDIGDALVELDPDARRPDPSTATTAPSAADPSGRTDVSEPGVSCRRSDRARSSCGPVLPVGDDTVDTMVMLNEDVTVIVSGDDLVAIDLADGGERWRTSPFVGARSVSAANDGGLLIAAVAGGLSAVDVATGAIRWTAPFTEVTDAATDTTGRQGTTSITPVPVWVGDGGVLARDPSGRMHAFDREDGARRWVEPAGAEATVATSGGLLTVGRDGLRLWHPDDPDPRWQRSGADLRLHPVAGAPARARPPEPVAGPLPLTSGRWLVDLEGGMTALPSAGPVEVALAGELTTVTTWTDDAEVGAEVADEHQTGAHAMVTAFDARGERRWQHDDVPLPCCTVRAVPAAEGELALATAEPGGTMDPMVLVLDATDGRVTETLRRDGATLEALTATTAVWRQEDRLVGLDRRTGREAFRATGAVTSVAPLLVQGPQQTIVVRAGGPIAPSDVARPGPRG